MGDVCDGGGAISSSPTPDCKPPAPTIRCLLPSLRMEDCFQYSLNFADFKLSLEEKLKFEKILVQDLSNAGLLLGKILVLVKAKCSC